MSVHTMEKEKVSRGIRPIPLGRPRPIKSSDRRHQIDIVDHEANPYESIDDHDKAKKGNFIDNPVDIFVPDVPPRNSSMGRPTHKRNHSGTPANGLDKDPTDLDTTCLARTPSGSVFIPSDLPKNSSPQHKISSPSHSLAKDDLSKTNPDRCQSPYNSTMLVPNFPLRNNLRRPNSNHFSQSRFHIRKSFASHCSWRCTALAFIFLSVLLSAALAYFAAMSMLKWPYETSKACSVMVDDAELVIAPTEANSTYRPPEVVIAVRNKDVEFARLIRQRRSAQRAKRSQMSAFNNNSAVRNGSDDSVVGKNLQTPTVVEPALVITPSAIGDGDGLGVARKQVQKMEATQIFVEMLEGSGSTDNEEQSDASVTIENSISPWVHLESELKAAAAKTTSNDSGDPAVAEATVAMATNVIITGKTGANGASSSSPTPVLLQESDSISQSPDKDSNNGIPGDNEPPPPAYAYNQSTTASPTATPDIDGQLATTGFPQDPLNQLQKSPLPFPPYPYRSDGYDYANSAAIITTAATTNASHPMIKPEGDISQDFNPSEGAILNGQGHIQMATSTSTNCVCPCSCSQLQSTSMEAIVTKLASLQATSTNINTFTPTTTADTTTSININNDTASTPQPPHSPTPSHQFSTTNPQPDLVPNNLVPAALHALPLTQKPVKLVYLPPALLSTFSGGNVTSPMTEATTKMPDLETWLTSTSTTSPPPPPPPPPPIPPTPIPEAVTPPTLNINLSESYVDELLPVKDDSDYNRSAIFDDDCKNNTASDSVGDHPAESVANWTEVIEPNDTASSSNSSPTSTSASISPVISSTLAEANMSTIASSTGALMGEAVTTTTDLPQDVSHVRIHADSQEPTGFPAKTLPPDGSSFTEISLGRRVTNDIPPYGHWNAQFHQPRTAFVRFNYTIQKDSSIGIYGRRNAIPTHTQYDFMEILSDEEKRRKRTTKEIINIVFVQYLEAGQWFLSMYNDDDNFRDVSFITAVADDLSVGCPYDCHDHGTCVRGVCVCFAGYMGHDCSKSVCPVLCSGNGEYVNGQCQCKPGWKGKECNLRYDECEVPGCNGHGHCIDGKCRCAKGYKGEFCEQVDCLTPDCSGHGVCVDGGSCICHRGWKGEACNDVDSEVRKCLPDCSGHGKFDLEKIKCICESRWTGPDCSKEVCDIECGLYGKCESGKCYCEEGWSGAKCDVKMCDPRCLEHGQCRNGSCICVQGWNGRHCTLEGCPHNCRGHGDCSQSKNGEWACQCSSDWDGPDCGIPLERNCGDGRDNDNDGLVDCEDSECCQSKSCAENLMCVSTADPLDILLKKQPPAVTASFFQRMRFLIEEDSVQNYVRKNAFNESRASVIRGRVISSSGSGLLGIRVSTTNSQEGFTVTRQTGWFDLMVNGGGAVTLQFQRDPFKPNKKSVMVPWNEVVVIDNVIMSLIEEEDIGNFADPCASHDYDNIKPVVLATWKHEFQGGCPQKSTILAESQVVQESVQIPGSEVHLVYHSSRAGGYMSTIQLQLTPERIPNTLRLIHLRISIEGIFFEKVFEADPGLRFTYAWNRRNVYRQRVYGVTTASVSVGYEYTTCKRIVWDVQTTKLSGHDMSITDIGGWNLDIHHTYNFHEGILQKGDGTNIYLRYKPKVLLTTMGTGIQRPLDCGVSCNGLASEQRLLAPVSIAASPDGSLYVGDFNLIRRIMPDRNVQTVLKLNPALVSYRYHLTVSPVDGSVYICDPESHQIIRVKSVEDIVDVENNSEVVIGSGVRCLPGDKSNCGDGGPAKDARLVYPKGIVFSADSAIYFADGTNIRMVDKKGIIRTLIGDHRHKGHWKPIPCHGTLNLDEVHLRWPTELAISPLDGSLHIIDDHMILKLTRDGRVKVVAGQPLHCPSYGSGSSMGSSAGVGGSSGGRLDKHLDLAIHSTLVFPESIAFAPTGELYIAESDSQRINRIRVIGTDGKISDFAGVESKCNCLERDCKCFDEDHFLASTSKLNTISSIAVTPDGIVHISDQGNFRIRSVMATLPEPTKFREYEIFSPETQEVYVFNRYGQHVMTKNILTGKNVYTFTYNLNTSFGKLNAVTDAAANRIYILRDYSNMVTTIENAQGQKVRLTNTRMRLLQDLIAPDAYNVTFDYHGSTGLLKSKRDSLGQSFFYIYDDDGRLTEAVTPSGEIIRLKFDLSVKGAKVMVTRDGDGYTSMKIKGRSVATQNGLAEDSIMVHNDGSVTMHSPWGQSIITETAAYSVLTDLDPVLGESFPVPSRQRVLIHDDLVHRLEWRFYLRKDGKGKEKHVSQVIRKMKVNGDNLLAIEYDRETFTEAVYDHNQVPLLRVHYDTLGRPQKWIPAYNATSVELKYDRFGRVAQWQRGYMSEQYGYNRQGRLSTVQYPAGETLTYSFFDDMSSMPNEIILHSGSKYILLYDGSGSLEAIVTPKGHKHEFSIQTSLGFYKLQYTAPNMRQPFIIQYNDRGQLLSRIYPGIKGRVSYVYNSDGKLKNIIFGDSKLEFAYYGDTGLVSAVSVDANEFNCRSDYKYHGSLMKEEKMRFSSKLGFSGVRIKYQYDGNARLQRSELELNAKEVFPLVFNHNANTGAVEAMNQFQVKRIRFNETIIEDKGERFMKIRLANAYGWDSAIKIILDGREVYRLGIVYDVRNRVRQLREKIGDSENSGGETSVSYTYTADGLLEDVTSVRESLRFRHDDNGNVVSMIHQQGQKSSNTKKEVKLRYNEGDRLIAYGDFDMNMVDNRGFVVQKGEEKFLYNAQAQLTSASHRSQYEVHYHYDSQGRLVARRDTHQNVTQYFYADAKRPNLVSHVHHPKTGQTYQLSYDDRGHLVAVEHRNANVKLYVATSHDGSPVAVFDTLGNVVKEVKRTPFGAIIEDTNPHILLHIDYQGGLRDPMTRLVHFGSRVYDPTHTQWMTPDWSNILEYLSTPQNLYLYRFRNNDPINVRLSARQYFTDMTDWLSMFGYNLDDMVGVRGSTSPGNQHFQQQRETTSGIASNLPVISGLGCAADVILTEFRRLSFVAGGAKVKVEETELRRLPRIRLAHKRSVLGDGILLSRVDGRVVVRAIEGSSQIVQDVMMSVLNGSHFLDIHSTSHDQDTFHFVKEGTAAKIHDDHTQLQRLGATFNVSLHESTEHGRDLKLHSHSVTLNIRYGTTVEQERHRLLKHARKRAVDQAWELLKEEEAALLARGGDGVGIGMVVGGGGGARGSWTDTERAQLLLVGAVDGYVGADIYDVDKYPSLADDPTNIEFKRRSSRRKRRKGRRNLQ